MEYGAYQDLMERYNRLAVVTVEPGETREQLIKRLMDNSYEKKQIAAEANAFIKENVTKYEQNHALLDAKAAAELGEFLEMLVPIGGILLDISIALRVGRLLLAYYQAEQDLEHIVQTLNLCATLDLLMKSHMDNFESTPYSLMAEQYLDDFDRLSDKGKKQLVRCWLLCTVNKKDKTFPIKKFMEIKSRFVEFRQKMGADFMLTRYLLSQSIAVEMAEMCCLQAEYTQKWGVAPTEPVIDMAEYGPLMEANGQEQKALFTSEEELVRLSASRVHTRLCLDKLDYHLGKITVEQLLERLKALSEPREDYDAESRCNALFMVNADYLRYLYQCSNYDRQQVMEEGRRVVAHVLDKLDSVTHECGPAVGAIQVNQCIIDFMSAASCFVGFELFKTVVLNATVYADKALYVHTMMVKEISLALLDYIVDHNPRYLDGVAGYDWECCRAQKQEIMALMENCALFHDIGKYFCLDIVSNSSRSLTDDEFELIKYHPFNFSRIYQGGMSPAIRCIRDCAEQHHLWYNEAGGYPQKAHTANKPLTNILTIADCIDAATDSIGRPYGLGKTFEQVRAEFDREREGRYSGYITELLHVEEIQRRIERVIGERRQEIYCEIYLGKR